MPRLLGGALFGGVIGAAAAAANALIERVTGKDVGDHVVALLHLPLHAPDEPVAIAQVTPPVPSPLSSAAVPQDTLLARATRQLRLMAALDAYAQRSRLLAAHAGERVDAQF
jgi:hypothetical protein